MPEEEGLTSAPLVSFIIPTHNRSDLLRETLDSVRSQTYRNLEIIVIDDCSTDDTVDVVREYASKDSRVRLIQLEKNSGACVARNVGFVQSSGQFINFLDSDDLIEPNKTERQLEVFRETPELDMVVCQMAHFNEKPGDLDVLWNTFAGDDPAKRFLRHDPVWGMHAPLWRREFLEKVGPFDETLPLAQEYELFTRAMIIGARVRLIPELLCYCRRHTGPSISTHNKALTRYKTLVQVFMSLSGRMPKDDPRQESLGVNLLWVSVLGAQMGSVELAISAFDRAIETWPPLRRFNRMRNWIWLAARTRSTKLYRWLRRRFRIASVPLDAREGWYFRHKVGEEALGR